MILKYKIANVMLAALAVHALWLGLCGTASAANSLDDWRHKTTEVRALAENDVPRAYQEASDLQINLPADATALDRIRALNLLARTELYKGLFAPAAKHSAEAKALAKKNNYTDEQIEANLVIALVAINQGRLEDMVDATKDSMELLTGAEREDLRAEVMFQVAMMYIRFEHFDEAVTVAVQSLDIARSSNNPMAIFFAEYGMAVAYERSGLYAQASENYQRMLVAARQAHSSLHEGGALLGLSSIADHLGDIVASERLCGEALALFRRAGGPFYTGHARHILASLYVRLKQPLKALPLFDENVALYEQHDNPIGFWWTLGGRSTALQGLGRLDAAHRDAERAQSLAKRIGFTIYLANSARRLSDIVAAEGDFKQAFQLSQQATDLGAKAERENTGKRILDLSKNIQEEAKQRQIDELTRRNEQQVAQQRWLWTLLGGSIVMLIGTAYFLRRLRGANHMLEVANEQLRQSQNETNLLNETLEARVEERTAELQQSRHSLAEAQRIAHVGSWEMNLVDNELGWSEEIYRIFEIDPQQFGASYEAFLNAVHPDDRAMVDAVYKKSLENREDFEIEHRLLLPDGRIKYVHERCETLFGDDGRALLSLGTAQDITERKRMEEALKESETRYRYNYNLLQTIIESPSDSVAIYAIDREYRLLSFNSRFRKAAKRLWNAEIEQGMCVLDAIDTEERREFFKQGADYVLAGNHGHLESSEERIEDGRLLREYHDNFGAPIYGDHGEVVGMTIFVLNTTERKETELKLKEALEFSEGVINAIPDILFEMDSDGRYLNVWTHTPELLAAQKDVLLGRTVREMLAPTAAATVLDALREAGRTGVSLGKTIALDLPETNWFELSVSHKAGGTFLVMSRDISARKQYEEAREAVLSEAQRLAELRSEFIAHMSHELRTPLNGILGYTQLLQRDKVLNERNADALNIVRQSGEHLLSLIDDILDLARIDANHFELEIGDIALRNFLQIVGDIVRVKAKSKDIRFDCELPPDLPAGVRGDEKRLRQVLLNLLSNAIKFTESGKVVLRVAKVGTSHLAFEVEDTGVGIAASELENIFQPFERAGDIRQRSGGTGLGLSISRQLVRLMGSDIKVKSLIGQGSTFRFELELCEVDLVAGNLLANSGVKRGEEIVGDEPWSEQMIAPPQKEMQALHQLALQGNMRDIMQFSKHIDALGLHYHPFAARLRQLAEAYQSQAILIFVEQHLNDSAT